MLEISNKYKIILGSGSPRRKQLLHDLGINFETIVANIDEDFPEHLKAQEIPLFLSKKKADFLKAQLQEQQLLITADTIVWLNNKAINKPENYREAFQMLQSLSGNKHEVYTGVCLTSISKQHCFYARTEVFFKPLSNDEIDYYITHYKPFDKAGSYGAQDWIGLTGVEKIHGSFYNVMGLPTKELYENLIAF
ncbi:MAG: septum formation protein Maf [Bacteroidia bacterium]|nr:septum formation protein Maf [Bacteroidia bacterium]MCZ2248393.1 Maf-like protein [Bacteroidia bacterium]